MLTITCAQQCIIRASSRTFRQYPECITGHLFLRMFTDVLIRPTKQKADRSDDELMRMVRRGDNEAFRILYNRYKSQLFIYCLRMLNDREAAQDLLQEVFVRMHENAKKYEPGTNFAGWIHTIARNLCINARRNRKEQVDFDEMTLYQASSKANDSDVMLREKLADEIAKLPDIYREAVILREYEGYSYKQIAEITEQPLSAVKFRIFKGRELLRESLKEWLDEIHREK